MDSLKKKRILQALIIIGFIGLLVSLYLIKNHYALPGKTSFCDYNTVFSCSVADSSKFSEFLGVPVAIWGAMWFIVLLALCWKALTHEQGEMLGFLLSWSFLGLLFVIYMVLAEYILGVICPLCTVLHLLVVLILVLGLLIYKAEENPKQINFLKVPKSWLKTIIIVNLLLLLLFNFFAPDKTNLEETAKCLTEKGGACLKTEELFGEAKQYLNKVECHPQGPSSKIELCNKKNIEGTPTWIIEKGGVEIKRHTGFLSIGELKSFAGC